MAGGELRRLCGEGLGRADLLNENDEESPACEAVGVNDKSGLSEDCKDCKLAVLASSMICESEREGGGGGQVGGRGRGGGLDEGQVKMAGSLANWPWSALLLL